MRHCYIIRCVLFELRYAFRNLRFRRGGLLRLTAVSAFLGIALGVASLIVVQAVYKGFREGVQENLLKNTAHITVGEPTGIDSNIVEAKIRSVPKVRNVKPIMVRSGVATHEGRVAYAVLKVEFGIQSATRNAAFGKSLAAKLNAKNGSDVEFVFPGTESPENVTLRVGEMIDTGLYEYDNALISVADEAFEAASGANAKPNTFLVTLETPLETAIVTQALRQKLGPGFEIEDWQSTNRPLFTALSFERRIANIILFLMIAIACFGITATLSILVTERSLEIAVLKTCGARLRDIALIFLTEGMMLGTVAVLAGTVLGVSACFGANCFGLVNLPGEVYSISKLELEPDLLTTLLIAFGTLLLVLVSVAVPVISAARVKPANILRAM